MSGGNIKVVVRCRPLNARELARGAKGLIRMENDQTILEPPEVSSSSSKATGKKPQVFSFDKSYWSAGPRDEPGYASQHTLYDDLGVELLDHSFEGFNTCIFAYGQTGSGKSYSMMGYGADKGIIPLTTSELFRRVESRTATDPNLSYTVEVSYIEIYNEKVRDLLNPKNKGNLRVREHPSLGPYVEDLSRLAVENYGQMMTLMDEGNKASRVICHEHESAGLLVLYEARTVASTNMNETSSRSHAVFTLILTQKRLDPQSNMTGEKVSKISLVDLAGSERQASTGATGQRLKEGANINKSLTTLGKVIAALAQASSDHIKGRKKKDDFVPYRDSVLTWLLKESLGGNSKTAMIAAISPADYEETLSTLRYADAAKKIKTHAIVNEDPNAKLIRELKEELELLRSRVASGGGGAALPGGEEAVYDPTVPPEKQIVTYKTKDGEIRTVTKLELQDQLEASEKLMESLNLTWEEKMIKTQAIHVEREKALEEMGIMVDKDLVGVHAPQKHPSLVNLNEDPLMSECLVYQLKPGSTVAGSLDGSSAQIKLSGSHILPNHCIFSNEDGLVTVEAMPDARTFVNGKRVPPKSPVKLLNGFRVILGDFHVFRFNDPASVRAQRRKLNGSASVGDLSGEASASPSPGFRPDSPFRTGEGELMDWSAARREVADIEKLGDQDLDKLFDDIVKVRTLRGRPESRYDIAAELESRLLATSQTDDTQTLDTTANPWAASGAQGTTLTSNSVGTPYAPELDVSIGEQQSDTATETAPALLTYDQKAQDAALEQRHLTKQLKNLAQEVKRIRSEAAAARALEEVAIEPAHWTARELRLVQGAVERWKRLRTFAMAEQILKGAVNLREANVRAKEMGRSVSYNFLVSDGSSAAPRSSLDGLNGVVEFEDVAGPTAGGDAPLVMIKVIDREANAVFSWDLARFTQQLSKMRHLCALAAKPNYSQHFRSEGIFTDHPAPTFSFIGAAKAPLRLLASQLSCTITVPIMCQYTMEAIGSCRVDFKCSLTLTAPSSGRTTPEPPSQPVLAALSPGSRLTFTVSVDCVKGLNSEDFASVHAQTRLSSLVGPSIASEDTFASLPVDLDKTSVAHLSLKRTVTVIVTPEMTPYLREEYATIEFFAKVRPAYLSRLERWDRTREVSPPSSSPGTPLRPGETRPAMRRNETDFVQPEHHDVLAKIEIRELAADGEHYPAEVVDGVIHLHQGLQRRLFVHLTHTSGKSLPWTKLGHVSTGDVRLVDKIGQITSVAKGEVGVKLNSEVEHRPDGTSVLSGIGGWDSAAHNSIHLNRKTSGDQRLLIRLLFLVEVETLDEPAVFSMDLPIRILARDTKRSSFLTFWSANKIFTSLTSIFAVDLSPPLARSAADLWVLDTGKKHVRGEERLGDWKPRSLSLLEDWGRMRGRQKRLGDVQATRAVLGMWREPGDSGAGPGSGWGSGSESRVEDLEEPPTKSAPAAAAQEREELLKRCLHLWQQAMEYRLQVDVQRASAGEEAVARKMRRLLPDLEPKLVPTVKQLPRSESVIRSGVLMLLRDSQANQWDKLHFVLRRPYLHVHTALTEREVQVINLTRANVVASPDVEMLLERRFAFTVFTPTNSYILQAASQKDMAEWMSVIATSSDA